MQRYIIRRLIQMIPLIFIITIFSFAIMHLAPGDPLDVMMDPVHTSPEEMAEAAERLGLNQPIYVQYLRWLGELFRGNMGYSYLSGRPVRELIMERLPATLLLTVTAIILTFTIAVPVGVVSALKRYSLLDRTVTTLSFGGISVPEFFLCLALLYVVSLKLKLLPTSGFGTLGVDLSGPALWADRAKHLIMPAVAMAVPSIAGIVRYARSSMIDVLGEDYIRTGRAKGLRERSVIFGHALKNSLIPVITLFGMQFPSLFGGAFVVEWIFDWPGMGTLAVRAASNREYSILMALNLVTAFLVLFGNLVADILYAVVDPRIRYE
jgi:peptide/nickel transport system permease protein